MALPKKKSRLITIDAHQFRWLVGPNDGYNVFVAQKEEVNGQKIEVYFETEINKVWTEFPHIQNMNLKILKPKDAESIIRQAIQLGWYPDAHGRPLVFDLKGDALIPRSR